MATGPFLPVLEKFMYLSYIALCGGLFGTFQCLDHICIFPLPENNRVN